MQQAPSALQGVTLTNLQATIVFVVGFLVLAAVVWKGVEALVNLFGVNKRKAKEKAIEDRFIAIQNMVTEQFDALEKRLTDAENRLDKGDQKFKAIREDSEQTLNVLNAMLMHFISGNDHEKLKETKSGLDSYLSRRE